MSHDAIKDILALLQLTEQLTEICARFIKHYSEKVAA